MKVVRVIKVIVLIAAILSLLVSAAGNFFILKDACDNDITAQEVHEQLDAYDFKIGSIFKASAEETEGDTEADTEQADEPETQTVPADDFTEQTRQDDTANEPAVPAFTEQEVADGSYKVGGHMGLVNGLMKAANARMSLGFLKDTSFDLCKFGKVGMRADEEGKPAFEVNLFLFISVACFTVAFILHLISKNRKKTIWGIIMMLFGFILFAAFYCLGQVLANIDINALSKVEIEDFAAYRIYVVAGCTFLGCLVGLGYLRCGSRAMKRRKRKGAKRSDRI